MAVLALQAAGEEPTLAAVLSPACGEAAANAALAGLRRAEGPKRLERPNRRVGGVGGEIWGVGRGVGSLNSYLFVLKGGGGGGIGGAIGDIAQL